MGMIEGIYKVSRSFASYGFKNNDELDYQEQVMTCKPEIRVFDRHENDEFIILGSYGFMDRYENNSCQPLIDTIR